jgi:hypothetical protein
MPRRVDEHAKGGERIASVGVHERSVLSKIESVSFTSARVIASNGD